MKNAHIQINNVGTTILAGLVIGTMVLATVKASTTADAKAQLAAIAAAKGVSIIAR